MELFSFLAYESNSCWVKKETEAAGQPWEFSLVLCDGVRGSRGRGLVCICGWFKFVWQRPQFSLSVVSNSATSWTAARQASLSITTPGVHPNPCPLTRWCHPTSLHNCKLCLQHNGKAIILQLKIHFKTKNLNSFHNYLKILIRSLTAISDKSSFPKYLNKDYPQRRKGQITQKNGQATWKDISQKKMAKKN